ncbi:MAG: trypsin-like peptidase domain-containing protein [Rickettsiales bacterium]|nr:trypsin-like peptidase domain-containing protein [Rickettsiales bacterium]
MPLQYQVDMGSAGRNLIRDLSLIIIVVLISKHFNPDNDRDYKDSYKNQKYNQFQEHSRQKKFFPGGGDLGVVDFGVIKSDKNSVSQGTANYIGDDYFITARHVVEGCMIEGVDHYPNSDLSIFKMQTPLANDKALSIKRGSNFTEGFIVGYPSGKAAIARTRYLGSAHQKIRGDFQVDNKVLVWAFYDLSSRFSSLAGMSGGAVIDSSGSLIGVLSGEVVRRGRVITTTLDNTIDVLNMNNLVKKYQSKNEHLNRDQVFNLMKSEKVILIRCKVY